MDTKNIKTAGGDFNIASVLSFESETDFVKWAIDKTFLQFQIAEKEKQLKQVYKLSKQIEMAKNAGIGARPPRPPKKGTGTQKPKPPKK